MKLPAPFAWCMTSSLIEIVLLSIRFSAFLRKTGFFGLTLHKMNKDKKQALNKIKILQWEVLQPEAEESDTAQDVMICGGRQRETGCVLPNMLFLFMPEKNTAQPHKIRFFAVIHGMFVIY